MVGLSDNKVPLHSEFPHFIKGVIRKIVCLSASDSVHYPCANYNVLLGTNSRRSVSLYYPACHLPLEEQSPARTFPHQGCLVWGP